ncbi:uncharacterized protein LOC123606598 isoform X1 [Leopardus geoffroyi]|uniref:uncharacterized protein LOC123606598 isoform X1 n=1 Tax=Leopardus geoffroyi TaxID=46844 RepID=UPI001E26475D|nr:uncharacterized protein LOC123606598 isoform X1 [Leopardus geoffroyi]
MDTSPGSEVGCAGLSRKRKRRDLGNACFSRRKKSSSAHLKERRRPAACDGLHIRKAATSLLPRKGKRIGETARRRDKFPQGRSVTDDHSRTHSLRGRRKQSTGSAAHAAAAAPVASTCFCPAARCRGLFGARSKKQTRSSDTPGRPRTHIFGLCNRPACTVPAVFRGRLFVCLKPRIPGACSSREPSSKTSPRLNIDQNLLQGAAAAWTRKLLPKARAKPGGVKSWRSAYLERCLRLNQ